MIIKSFTAESANAALKRVRKEMGGDAVVLQTRQIPGAPADSRFEITACLERHSVAQTSELLTAPAPTAVADVTTPSDTPELNLAQPAWAELSLRLEDARVRAMAERLRDSDLPAALASAVLVAPSDDASDDEYQETVRKHLQRLVDDLSCDGLGLKPGDRVAVVGPAGCGKSSVIGRLAAEQVAIHRTKVTLRTIDDAKLGAFDEAIGMAEASGAQFADPTSDPSAGFSKKHINLIDTPALPLMDARRERLVRRLAEMEPTHCVAVFGTPMRSLEVERYAELLRELNVTHVALTMLDLSPRWGGGLAAAHFCNRPLALVTDAHGGFGSMTSPDAAAYAQQLLSPEASHVR